jgi:hypothetical protein
VSQSILAPAAVLVAWTILVLFWMAARRFPAMKQAGIDLSRPLPGGRRGQDLEGVIPDSANWIAHNYAHLLEQPTAFYAVCAILAITGSAGSWDLRLAWAYVGLRVAHSLVQCTVNYVPVRFGLFLLSTFCLLGLAVSALKATL